MKLTYDEQANAAYVMLVQAIEPGESVNQLHSFQTPGGKGELILDFDSDGRILGLEILGARQVLRPDVLKQAARLE